MLKASHFIPARMIYGFTVNERDGLGARVPADFLAHVSANDFFGCWPYAYNGPNPDPIYGVKRPDLVAKTRIPEVLFEERIPLRSDWYSYTGSQFPPGISERCFCGDSRFWALRQA